MVFLYCAVELAVGEQLIHCVYTLDCSTDKLGMTSHYLIDVCQLGQMKGFLFAHVNIRSLINKIDLVRLFVYQCNIDCLCLTETWLRDIISDSLISIQGFKLVRWDHPNTNKHTRGGGVCMYVRDSCDVDLVNCPINSDGDLEYLSVRIMRNHAPPTTCIIIYRPPKGSTKIALQKIRAICDHAGSLKGEILVHGDFNIDYSKKHCIWAAELKSWEMSMGLTQLIKSPTRVSRTSASVIDLCFTNMKFACLSGTIGASLSDHVPIFVLKKKSRESYKSCAFRGRCYKNLTPVEIKRSIRLENLDLALSPDENWNLLETAYVDVADIVCPVRDFTIKRDRPSYFTKEVTDVVRERDTL